MKNTVVVMNNLLTRENLLILEYEGGRVTKSYNITITPDIVEGVLKNYGLTVDVCKIVIVNRGWRGDIKVEEV